MNNTDRAIVVGISRYADQDFPNLDSPENDANVFFEWLVSPYGGALQPEKVERILSSGVFMGREKLTEFKPPSSSPSDALPGVAEVQRAFDRLHDMANENARKGKGHYLGRRLYIYMSGHGFAPSDPEQEAGLYMANVTRDRGGYHILGRYNAEWFFRAACFDEILLFMDCCRTLDPVEALNKPYSWVKHPDALKRVKCLYGFATQWSKSTRERKIDGVARGVFTAALVEGLKMAAAGPDGKITTNSLYNYLTEHMKEFMAPEDRDDASLSNEPYLHTHPERGEGFVIVELSKKPKNVAERVTQFVFGTKPEAPKFPVVLQVPAGLSGKPIQILDHLLQPLGSPIVAQPEVKLELQRGMYLMQVEGSTTPHTVEVSGVGGEVNVKF